jgi:prepilin peptidase CpaA
MEFLDFILWTALLVSLITDLRSRKILNIVTIPAILAGMGYHMVTSGFNGFIYSGKGLLIGFALLMIPFVLGGIGAGDVKLLAAIGSLKGTAFVFSSFLYTALIGGAVSIIIISFFIGRKKLLEVASYYKIPILLKPIREDNSRPMKMTFPYGIAIVLGTFSAYIWGGFTQ